MKRLLKLRAHLEKLGVHVNGTAAEFHSNDEDYRGLWVSLESGSLADHDVWSNEFASSKVHKAIEKAGYYLEQYDSGTGMILES